MSIDFSQFKDGDQVAFTLVGTWFQEGIDTERNWYSMKLLDDCDVVDMYKIEPAHKKGDLFKNDQGAIFLYEGNDSYRCLLGNNGKAFARGDSSILIVYSRESFGLDKLTPVKVVDI